MHALKAWPFCLESIALWGHISFSQMRGQLNGTNLWWRMMRLNNNLGSSIWNKDEHIQWIMTDDLWQSDSGGRRGLWITSIAGHMQGITGTAVADPPPLSTSCFSCLSARFCLYNTSCVWRHSSLYYTAALIQPWLLTRRANRQTIGKTDHITAPRLHHTRSANQDAVPLKAFWKL